jgi:hypothetical protein
MNLRSHRNLNSYMLNAALRAYKLHRANMHEHLATYENLEGLSICDQSDVQQQALGPKGVEAAQQRGSVRW